MKRSLKKGIWYAAAPGKSVLEKFQAAKAAGFDGIEPPSHLDQDEVLRARDETGLAIPDVSCGQHSRGLSLPDAAKRATRPFMKEMDDATYDAAWTTYLPAFPKDADITEESYRKELEFEKSVLPASIAAPVPYDQAVDASFVRKARQELAH